MKTPEEIKAFEVRHRIPDAHDGVIYIFNEADLQEYKDAIIIQATQDKLDEYEGKLLDSINSTKQSLLGNIYVKELITNHKPKITK